LSLIRILRLRGGKARRSAQDACLMVRFQGLFGRKLDKELKVMSDNHGIKAYKRQLTPIERLFTRSPFALVTMVARIRGTVTESMLQEAVSKVRQRHQLAAFSARDDVVTTILKREKMDSLERISTGTAVTNLTRLDFPRGYGALELDRLIMKPGGGFPLVNFNLVLGAVTCAGKLSLVIEFVEDNVAVKAMEKIRDRALEFLLEK
jgi:hypothetical protein